MAKNSVTRMLSRSARRLAMAGQCGTLPESESDGVVTPPLPVRRQGEEGTSPGQREQSSLWEPSVTGRRRDCAISVTNSTRVVVLVR
jgi:hypothetical protein